MYNVFFQRTREAIAELVKHIRASDRFRTTVFDGGLKCVAGTPCFDPALSSLDSVADRVQWRIIDHCAAVTRIYAIFEQFAHEMIREHINLLQSRIIFTELPHSIRAAYRMGIARILEKKDGPRYADLDINQLIGDYDRALNGKGYTLEPRAMLMQEQNLRLPELARLLAACGVDGAEVWIEQHHAVRKFFAENERLAATATKEMSELIKYRNDAAHGSLNIGDILHVNVLTEFCHFIEAVCEAIAEKVQISALNILSKNNDAIKVGTICQSIKGGMVGVGSVIGTFKLGKTIYLCGENYCLERKIVGLQLNGVPYAEVELPNATEIGIEFDAPGRKNALLMVIEPIKAPAATECTD